MKNRAVAERFPRSLYSTGEEPDPRFSFANERTFLAWIRTALALLAGGVAIKALPLDIAPLLRAAVSIALVATGTVGALHAWFTWFRAERAMRQGEPLPAASGTTPLALALVSIGLAVGAGVLLA
ncbi:DUF202 domain-containing protein [Rhodococcus sp. Eu-32]|uniref:YidH family protein n=1 Tax=Rhodococcus sp. Eu-32 TaxID=1017319 RepID=UPI000DF39366|nr:DUF202 domain-containing protein [Rhodococcus sp. Eu-32]RRQ25014.1 DUF202 domain-containing protein [Rhodococcus sp. Eu-32]